MNGSFYLLINFNVFKNDNVPTKNVYYRSIFIKEDNFRI